MTIVSYQLWPNQFNQPFFSLRQNNRLIQVSLILRAGLKTLWYHRLFFVKKMTTLIIEGHVRFHYLTDRWGTRDWPLVCQFRLINRLIQCRGVLFSSQLTLLPIFELCECGKAKSVWLYDTFKVTGNFIGCSSFWHWNRSSKILFAGCVYLLTRVEVWEILTFECNAVCSRSVLLLNVNWFW